MVVEGAGGVHEGLAAVEEVFEGEPGCFGGPAFREGAGACVGCVGVVGGSGWGGCEGSEEGEEVGSRKG